MFTLRKARISGPVALIVSMVVAIAGALTWGVAATSASPATSTAAVTAAAPPVATTPTGTMTAPITGMTADEDAVTGTFTPLNFSKKKGKVFVRGVVSGTITDADTATSRTFTVIRKTRVISINGTPTRARAAAAMAPCEVLDLVLGPLNLDLLGLVVDLNRIELNITAVPGPGNLLGNLLCTVAGLLDGGLQGLLGRLVTLLNRILGQLGLGL